MLMANYGFAPFSLPRRATEEENPYEMAMFSRNRGESLALQPALADDLFGNHPLTPEARMRSSPNRFSKNDS